MRIHEDEIHQTYPAYPIGSETVPDQNPQWNYNTLGGILARERFIARLPGWYLEEALKPVNLEKFQEVIQDKQENLSQFLEYLTKVLFQYTNLDHEIPEGKQLLMTPFPRTTPTLKPNLDIWRGNP